MSACSSSIVDIISLNRLPFATDLQSCCSDTFVDSPPSTPLDILPDELLCAISCYLDIESLARSRLVNKRFMTVASRDEAGWRGHCETLWATKAHVCKDACALLEKGHSREAFHLAGRDALTRHHVSREELCFDPVTGKGFVWSFRFKAAAGSDWISRDPWWSSGGRARQMVFLKDGTVMQYIPDSRRRESDATGMTDYATDFSLVPAFHDANGARMGPNPVGLDVQWRFISQPMDLTKRPDGAYIRLTIAGRDVPTYVVHRSPTGNWGFVMESCWGVYSSFPLPPRRQRNDTATARGNQVPRPPRMRLRRTTHGVARWFNVADMESEDEGESDSVCSSRGELDDSDLTVTTAWQWREALLYNYGAVWLPEGEGATAEFDRVWSQAVPNHNTMLDQGIINFRSWRT